MARTCSGSRHASVTSWSRCRRTQANAVPHEPPPTTTTFTQRSPWDEVDRHRDALELELLTQLILDPVGVIARHQAAVVDREAKTRRPRGHLRTVEEVEALAILHRGLAPRAEVGQEAVQLRRRGPGDVLVELPLDHVEQPLDAPPGLRRDGDVRWTLSQPSLELGADVLDRDRRQVPLREHHDGRALCLAGDVCHVEVLVDEALRRVDENERDVGALRGVEGTQLRVVLDALAMTPLAAHARRV